MGAQDWVTSMVATCAENIRHPMVTEVPISLGDAQQIDGPWGIGKT